MSDLNTPIVPITAREAAQNASAAGKFILRGAERRRSIAYGKAKLLQQELGVIPRLVSVK